MPRLSRRSRALASLAVAGLLAGLTSCGKDDSGTAADPSPSASTSDSATASSSPSTTTTVSPEEALANITVSGKQGVAPKVTWSGKVEVDATTSETLVTGKGDPVKDGDQVFAHVWVGDGSTKKEVYSSYATAPAPLIAIGPGTLPALNTALADHRIGDRVLVASTPLDAYGAQGNTSLGIQPTDTVVFVVDLLSTLPTEPSGTAQDPASWAPSVTETDGVPSALNFSAAPQPGGSLQRTFLIRGEGPKTTKGQHIYVNYLGQVYGGDKPFDQSYGRSVFDFDLGAGSVVAGWDKGLVGVPVGSRVILAVPPDQGYGDAGQPSVGITGTDTMYFVVDVLAAV
ncbi:MAG: FKBP-type peptidyl-prolyl cis-trans isomerase [Nocardioides sp.]